MRTNVPAAIASAAVNLLLPYHPGLSPESLIDALKNLNAVTKTPKTPKAKPMTRRQVAELLQISIASVNRRMKDGTLRAFKVGKRAVRIDPASVEALMQSERETSAALEA